MGEDRGYVEELLIRLGLSDFAAETIGFLVTKPLRILLILVAARLLIGWGSAVVRRSLRGLHRRAQLSTPTVRSELRAQTLADVAGSSFRVGVWAVAALVVLDELGVNLAPLLAGAGIAGIAIGFGAQSLVRDVLAGVFILAEDRYGVGDVVDLGEAKGTVEDVNLRVTRLRAVDGTVWFVNNGELKRVGNSSMEWSRALLDVTVGHGNDLERVTGLITEEMTALAGEDPWRDVVVEDPELWGVQAVGPEGVTIRLVLKTTPGEQYAIGRELRGRIAARLTREGVSAPAQMVLVTTGLGEQTGPPPTERDRGA